MVLTIYVCLCIHIFLRDLLICGCICTCFAFVLSVCEIILPPVERFVPLFSKNSAFGSTYCQLLILTAFVFFIDLVAFRVKFVLFCRLFSLVFAFVGLFSQNDSRFNDLSEFLFLSLN